jgi:hypothetical protein
LQNFKLRHERFPVILVGSAGLWQFELEALVIVSGIEMAELWIGVATAEQLKALSGIDFLQGMIDGRLPRPPISGLLGFQLIEVRKGFAAFAGSPGPQHYNPIGSVHGGYGATLLAAPFILRLRRARATRHLNSRSITSVA